MFGFRLVCPSLIWSLFCDWVCLRMIWFGLVQLGLFKFGLVEFGLVWFWLDLVGLVLSDLFGFSQIRNRRQRN